MKSTGSHLLLGITSLLSSCSKDSRRELRIEDIDEPKVQLCLRRKKESLEDSSGNGVISFDTGTPLLHPIILDPDAKPEFLSFKFTQFIDAPGAVQRSLSATLLKARL